MTEVLPLLNLLVLCLPGVVVCSLMMGLVRENGGQVRTAAFGWSDVLLAFFFCGYFAVSASGLLGRPDPAAEMRLPKEEAIAAGASLFLGFVGVICLSLTSRKVRPFEALGFRGWPFWKALPIGAGFVLITLPLLMLVGLAVKSLLPQVKEQDVVTAFRMTQQSGDRRLMIMLAFMAVVFQPIVEEIFFRGYFYSVFKGWAGATASAIFTCVLFAAVHSNVAALLPLLFLAFFLTLAYEWSGSLLVPIGMHMTFNGVQLAILTWWPQLVQP